MKKQTRVAVIAGAILVVVGAAAVLYDKLVINYSPNTMVITEDGGKVTPSGENQSAVAQNVSNEARQGETTKAPDFTVQNLEGNPVSLHSMEGKPVIVNFWASWCPPCKQEMPDFEAAYKQYGEDVNFMMVNMTDGGRETIESAMEYIESQGYTFPVYFDTNQNAAITYAVSAIPTTYFIDSQGNLAAYAAGAITAAHLEQGVSMIRGKN